MRRTGTERGWLKWSLRAWTLGEWLGAYGSLMIRCALLGAGGAALVGIARALWM